jgi:hypothetical protein
VLWSGFYRCAPYTNPSSSKPPDRCASLREANNFSVDSFAQANNFSVDSFAQANNFSVDSFAKANNFSVDLFAKANNFDPGAQPASSKVFHTVCSRKQATPRVASLTLLLLFVTFTAAASLASTNQALVLDGTPNEAAWKDAKTITDFALTQPFKRTAPELKTQVKVLSTPEGLALAFACDQPAAGRSNSARARDAEPNSDAVSAIIDFDGNASRAYEFTVSAGGAQKDGIWSGERNFSADWDGLWQSGVASNDTGWTAELLIPWASVPMVKARTGTRTISLTFDRAVWNLGERHSYPAISATQNRYLSDFATLSIASYQQSALSIVPYASVQYDFVDHSASGRTGADVSWRPNGEFALTATVRPDFGQVESDQLVVNFDAIEVAFSDKRPFFTENQAFFDVRDSNGNQLIYTRRIGAQNALDGAVKLNGASHGIEYGAFAATESNAGGKGFLAARALIPGQVFSAGYVLTKVSDPFGLDALVQGADFKLRPDKQNSLDVVLVASDRQIPIATSTSLAPLPKQPSRDFGGTASWEYTGTAWDFGSHLTHYGRDFNVNDFGYLARADFNSIYLGTGSRPQTPRADGAALNYSLQYNANANDRGDRLSDNIFAYRQVNASNGAFTSANFLMDLAGVDDLISRGNGLVRRPTRVRLGYFRQGPQRGKWRTSLSMQNFDEGLGGRAWNFVTSANYQASSTLALDGNVRWRTSKDWLVWRGADAQPGGRIRDLFARYQRTQFITNFNANWIPTPKHELRLKLQSLIINANNARAVRLGPGGALYATNDVIAPLQVRNLGVQLRYKYEFAPLRELYLVYARGGFELERFDTRSSVELFQDSFDLRDSDQFLVKLRWGL